MNDKLNKLDDKEFDRPGEKAIFYWGWYWREVNFDDYPYSLATDEDSVGFCENNKWGYREIDINEKQSKELRTLIEAALVTEKMEDFDRVNNFMQGLK